MYRQALAVAAAVILFAQVSNGQLIQFGPEGGVRVNAPFVRVEVGPTGETYVRAPFTSVYAPGRPFIRHPVGRPVFGPTDSSEPRLPAVPATGAPLTKMSWRALRQHLRDSASQLDAGLNRLADAEVWLNYLQPRTVLGLVSQDTDRAPTQEEVEQFRALYQTFESTVANPRLGRITELPGFHGLLQGLREISAAPPARLRLRLAASAVQLDQDLRQFASAATWRRYLELPLEIYAAADQPDPMISNQTDISELELMLRRYDGVSRSPQYESVAALDSFRATRQLLGEYVLRLRELTRVEPEPTPAEPLPVPEPIRE